MDTEYWKIMDTELLVKEFQMCFVCGNTKYREFYYNDTIYRVCFNCLKRPNVKEFFS